MPQVGTGRRKPAAWLQDQVSRCQCHPAHVNRQIGGTIAALVQRQEPAACAKGGNDRPTHSPAERGNQGESLICGLDQIGVDQGQVDLVDTGLKAQDQVACRGRCAGISDLFISKDVSPGTAIQPVGGIAANQHVIAAPPSSVSMSSAGSGFR